MCLERKTDNVTPIPATLTSPRSRSSALRSLRLRHTPSRYRTSSEPARVPACQGIPARRGAARLPPLACGHAGIRLYPPSRLGDRSVSRARRLYRILSALSRAIPRTGVPLPGTRIFPSRSACRREKRTLICVSGTQRVSHINITMSSAWSVAFRLQVAAARWPRSATQRIYHSPNTMSSGFAGPFLARTQSVTAGSRRTHAQTELRIARWRTIGHWGCTCKGDLEAAGYRVGSRKFPVINIRQRSATLSS